VLMHAPKNGFFYVLDRKTGELLSAEPWVTVNWSSGVNLKTGRPTVNPEARYGADSISIMPGPGGGHVWPPWSFSPTTGLVYLPSTIGGAYTFQANPDFVPGPMDLGLTGRGQMNMGTGRGGGGGAGAGRGAAGAPGAAAGAGGGAAAGALPPGVDAAAVAAGRGGAAGVGAGGAAGAGRGAAGPPPPSPPSIGPLSPTGRSMNILSAWDPVTNREKWRGLGAGFNQGGTLATAGNLVFSSVNNRLLVYKADNGDVLLDLPTGLTQMGPPMTYMLDGKQYIVLAGGPPAAAGGGGAGRGAAPAAAGAPATPPAAQPSHMITLVVDGTTPLPGVAPAAPGQGKQ